MNAEKFSEALNRLDSGYLEKAIHYQPEKRTPAWVKWGIMAACLLLVLSLAAIPFINLNSPPTYRSLLALSAYATDGSSKVLSASSSVTNSVTNVGENFFGNNFPMFQFYVGPSLVEDDVISETGFLFHDVISQTAFLSHYEIEVSYNGKVTSTNDEHIAIFRSANKYGLVSPQYLVTGWFEEPTDLQIMLKERLTGKTVETVHLNVRYDKAANAYHLTVLNIDTLNDYVLK